MPSPFKFRVAPSLRVSVGVSVFHRLGLSLSLYVFIFIDPLPDLPIMQTIVNVFASPNESQRLSRCGAAVERGLLSSPACTRVSPIAISL